MEIGFYSNLTIKKDGTTQLRCIQPANYLRQEGHNVVVKRIYEAIPRKGEITIIHRGIYDYYTEKFIQYAKALGNPVLYDIDDLLFDPEAAKYLVRIGKIHNKNYDQVYQAMRACDSIISSTHYLADRAVVHFKKVDVLLNALSKPYLRLAESVFEFKKKQEKQDLTLAYLSGTNTHDFDFKVIEKTLLKILADYPQVKLLIVGPLIFSKEFYQFNEQFEHRPFVAYSKYPSIFKEIDLNLVPLEQSETFCQGKSELKFIEAGVCGVPSLVTPTEPYLKAIEVGVTSEFSEDHEWFTKITQFIQAPEKLKTMGQEARDYVLIHYHPSLRAKEWHALISSQNFSLNQKKSVFQQAILLLGLKGRLAKQFLKLKAKRFRGEK
jgi:glycosyltransferase involved in cell wall biosynthesis